MIEKGNFSDFNLRRIREVSKCPDVEIAKILDGARDVFPMIYLLQTETTRFYSESFPELQQYIKREKRLVVFETPSRVSFTHEYTIEGAGNLKSGFHFLFNTAERLSWLKCYIEERRVSIASKEKVVYMLKKKLKDELFRFADQMDEDADIIAWRLYDAADGKPCFVEFNQKEQRSQQSLLFSITFFDSIRNKTPKNHARKYSPLQEKELSYNYSTFSDNANAWIYFKAPANFVLNVRHNASESFYEESKSNDDEITSLVLKPKGERLSVDFTISVNVPTALKVWYCGMFWLSGCLCFIGLALIGCAFFEMNLSEVVKTFENCAFAMIAAIIATRGWLMSEEQVMKKMSNWYTTFVVFLVSIILILSVITMNKSNSVSCDTCNCDTMLSDSIPEACDPVKSLDVKSGTYALEGKKEKELELVFPAQKTSYWVTSRDDSL